jgi:hypothetical protein
LPLSWARFIPARKERPVRPRAQRADVIAIASCLVVLIVVLGGLRAARYLSLGPDAATRHERLFDLRRDASHPYLTALKYVHTGRIERPYSPHPETRRPFGYSVFLSWFLAHVSESRTVTVVLASIWGVLTSLIVFLVVLRTVGQGRPYASAAAALVAGAWPYNLQLSVTGSMEPAFSLLYAATMALVIRIVTTTERRVPSWLALAAGTVLGLAVWTRGNALVLPVAGLALTFLLWRRGRPCWGRVGILVTLPMVASIGLQVLALHAIAGRYTLPSIGVDTTAHYLVHAAAEWKRTGSLAEGNKLGNWFGENYQFRYLGGGEDDETLLDEARQRMWDGLRAAPLYVFAKFVLNWAEVAEVGTFSGSKWEKYLSTNLVLATLCLFGACVLAGVPGAAVIAIFWLVVGAGAACTTGQRYRVFAHSELLLAYTWVAVPLLWRRRADYLRIALTLGAGLAPVAAFFVLRGGWGSLSFALSRFTALYLLLLGLSLITAGMLRAFLGRAAASR